MQAAKYKIKEVEDLIVWDEFVEKSPQGTGFSNSLYLNSCDSHYEIFFIYKGDEIKAGLCLTTEGKSARLDDLVIYNGILFPPYNPDQRKVTVDQERFEISEYITKFVSDRYEQFETSFSPEIKDIRPFLWHNYGSKNPKEIFNYYSRNKARQESRR